MDVLNSYHSGILFHAHVFGIVEKVRSEKYRELAIALREKNYTMSAIHSEQVANSIDLLNTFSSFYTIDMNELEERFPVSFQKIRAELMKFVTVSEVRSSIVYVYANDSEWKEFEEKFLSDSKSEMENLVENLTSCIQKKLIQ